MELRDAAVEIRGKSPLLMHRYAGEQPSEEKAPRGKKTQEWIDKSRKKKWLSAAYFANDTFHIPPENIEGMLIRYAARLRKTDDFKEGIMVVEDFIPLIVYSSLEDKKGRHLTGKLEDFYEEQYRDIRGVVIASGRNRNRIDACRPIFTFWGLKFTLRWEEPLIGIEDIKRTLDRSALGDFRPRFGRFSYTIKMI